MKQTIRTTTAILLALCMGTIAYAQVGGEGTPRPKPKNGDGRMEKMASTTDRGDRGENMRNASTSAVNDGEQEDAMRQERQQRVGNALNKMGARFEATLAREDGLVTRILSRIEKIKTAGGKTDTAEKLVADAKTKIDSAKALLATLKANVDAQVSLAGTTATSTMSKKDVKTADQNIRKTTMTLEKGIQSAQMILDKAVKALTKDNHQVGQNNENSSTTPERRPGEREGTTTQN